jgi:hypothetical protein
MQHSYSKIIYLVALAFVAAAIAGCSNDESSATSEEPSMRSGDKWLDAGNVKQLYDAQIGMDAINAGKDPFEADKSCTAILSMARKSLSDASNVGTPAQLMYKTCNDVGLKFQNEVRCEADRLQVLCR